MKYFPKCQKDSFIVFPASYSIRATLLSVQNLITNLKKRDPNLIVTEFAYSDTRRLEIRTVNEKNFQMTNDNEKMLVQQEKEFLVKIDGSATIASLITNLNLTAKWLGMQNIEDQIIVSAGKNYLKFTLSNMTQFHSIKNKNNATEKLLIIDGSNVLTKGYFATKKAMLKTKDGIYTNAVLSFVKTLFKLVKQYKPTHLAVCWDSGRDKVFRRKSYPAYKANRTETEPELKQQYETVQSLLSKMNVAQFFDEEYEADDLIGTLVQKWNEQKSGNPCYFVSNDKDLHQLLNINSIQIISKNNEDVNFSSGMFEKKYGITIDQWVDVKALLGDTSDNIPGVKGVGEKAALPLIQNYGSIELLFDQLESLQESAFKRYYSPLKEGREEAFLSKQLSRIVTNVPSLDQINFDELKMKIDKKSMFKAFNQLEFFSLLEQIQKGVYRAS